MIEKPDMIYALVITLIPAVVGCVSTVVYFTLGGNKNRGFIPMLGCIFFIGLSMWYFGEELNQYNLEVLTLIHDTECNNLPEVANQYKNFKGDVIDEIVLRCLIGIDNNKLISFIMENGI